MRVGRRDEMKRRRRKKEAKGRFGTFLPSLKSNIRTARKNLGASSPSTI